VRQAVEAAVDRINGEPGRLATWRELDALIQDQHWRAAHFRVAADDINYRRFFNINELAGLRTELPELFDQAHRLVFELLRDGVLDGLRIDHIDGLLDPKGYLLWLREHAPGPFYLVVEKILARHEALRKTGRSKARPATNSPIWYWACLSIRPGKKALRKRIRLLPTNTVALTRSCANARSA
jgi:(1->4)-alpha-D-glucan 1-alpha-D-glucosylmutase